MRRRAFLAAAGASTVAIAGCMSASGSDGDYDIGMSTSKFRPFEFAVAPGTTVVWRNTSKSTHTVTAYADELPDGAEYFASGGFDDEQTARDEWLRNRGGAIEQGDTYEHTFEVPGDYPYLCIPHEKTGMTGVIRVTEDATRTPEGGSATGGNRTSSTASGDTAIGGSPDG